MAKFSVILISILSFTVFGAVPSFFAKVFGEVCFMDFSGLSGATALSAIAFSVVFLVLTGLTCVIYAMRIVSKSK